MASKRFKKVLIVRFLSYFVTIIGTLSTLFQFGPLLSVEASYRIDRIFGVKHQIDTAVVTSAILHPSFEPTASVVPGESPAGLGGIKSNTSSIIPVSTEYGIVIEKINANAVVIPNVDPGVEKQYVQALAKGVAEASGSTKPGEVGNLFIFSHSADAPWNIIRFNAIFYLLRELEKGDRVLVFYQGRRYDYIVYNRAIVSPKDVTFLNNRYDKPVLTLQTCDPPGTLSNRLIVQAKLLGS